MVTNSQIYDWEKHPMRVAEKLYDKWCDAKKLRRTILAVLFVLTNSLLLTWAAMSLSSSPAQAVLAYVLAVVEDILGSVLWRSEYFMGEDIRKQADNLNLKEMEEFNHWAYGLIGFYRPLNIDRPSRFDISYTPIFLLFTTIVGMLLYGAF